MSNRQETILQKELDMNIPDELRYTKDHEWVRLDGNTAVVGITEFAQSELGDLVFVELPKAGKTVQAGEVLCVVESTKAASDVYVPISGTVKEVNSALQDSPQNINSNPYQEGWIAKLDGVSSGDIAKLLSAAQYREVLSGK